MWGIPSREQNHKDGGACWDRKRDAAWIHQAASTYFDDVLAGRYCASQDWYEGAGQNHGDFSKWEAPALLGFDSDSAQKS